MNRYYRTADGWLARVDGNPVLPIEESQAHAAAEYRVSGVTAEDHETDPRQGTLLMPPPPPPAPAPAPTLAERIAALEAEVKAIKGTVVK